MPVDPIDCSGVGGKDAFLGDPAVAGRDIPKDDVPVASSTSKDTAVGVFDAPFNVMYGEIDFVCDLVG